MDARHGAEGPGSHRSFVDARLSRRVAAAAGAFGIRCVSLPARYRWTGWLLGLACLVLPRPVLALYEPEKAGAASRRWAINVEFQEYYDDNINTTASNAVSGFQSSGTVGLKAETPAEQT